MIDFSNERILSFPKASAHLREWFAGTRPHVSTLYRWSSRGLRGVVLESGQAGGVRCTSVEALQRFFERLSVSEVERPERDAEPDDLEAQLDGEGI